MQLSQGHSFEPVGRCIYCGTTEGPLRKEHVIPKMLAGNMTLPAASCIPCEKVTKKLEQYMGRRVFRDLRVQHGFPMTEKPTHLPTFKTVPEFGQGHDESNIVLVPTADHPGFIMMAAPAPAGIIEGRPLGSSFQGETVCLPVTADYKERGKNGARFIYRELSLDHVGRFYAKVALGLCVGIYGVGAFENELGPIVLEKNPNWPHWVGGTTQEMDQFPPIEHDKPVVHRSTARTIKIEGEFYAGAQIQLLAYFGMPIFTVVAGKMTEEGLRQAS